MNRILQNEQMDLQIRPNANNLFAALQTGINVLPTSNLIQLSIDGPSTNWVVLKKFIDQRSRDELPPIEDIGSCGLHIVSEAFQVAFNATEWSLDHQSYTRLGEHKTTIKELASLTPSKRHNNMSYDTLLLNYKDPTMKIKIHPFKDLASFLETFLKEFRTDQPMLPFLSDVMENIMRRLMKMFLQRKIKTVTPYQLINMDTTKRENQLIPEKLSLPATISLLSSLTSESKKKFLKDSLQLLICLLTKLQETSPLKSLIVRCCAALSPPQHGK